MGQLQGNEALEYRPREDSAELLAERSGRKRPRNLLATPIAFAAKGTAFGRFITLSAVVLVVLAGSALAQPTAPVVAPPPPGFLPTQPPAFPPNQQSSIAANYAAAPVVSRGPQSQMPNTGAPEYVAARNVRAQPFAGTSPLQPPGTRSFYQGLFQTRGMSFTQAKVGRPAAELSPHVNRSSNAQLLRSMRADEVHDENMNEQNPITASAAGRVELATDTTRLALPTSGGFLPSSIPIAGQPFAGAPGQTGIFTTTAFVTVQAATPTDFGNVAAKVQVAPVATSTGDASVVVPNAYAHVDNPNVFGSLGFGLAETAFAADLTAVPETLDITGPNARVTIYQGGLGNGQARASYFMPFIKSQSAQVTGVLSAENPVPEIKSGAAGFPTTSTVASVPDFIGTLTYSGGETINQNFIQSQRLQFGALVRSLGLDTTGATGFTSTQRTTGWGVSLSGMSNVFVNPASTVRDSVYVSATYGNGIAHYINDLHTASTAFTTGGNDAAFNSSGALTALPTFAWYTGYTHNWGEKLRSTVTYSQVNLYSHGYLGSAAYRTGEYLALNFVYHVPLYVPLKPGGTVDNSAPRTFLTGPEYIYGQHESFSQHWGSAQRILWVVQAVH
jgi:hypothetical protein